MSEQQQSDNKSSSNDESDSSCNTRTESTSTDTVATRNSETTNDQTPSTSTAAAAAAAPTTPANATPAAAGPVSPCAATPTTSSSSPTTTTSAVRSGSTSSGSGVKATVVLSAQLQNEIKKYLARVEASLFPSSAMNTGSLIVSANLGPTDNNNAASVLGLDGSTPERSVSVYSSAGDLDKLFIIARSHATFREGALGLLATVCNDPRNHYVMCRKGLARDLCAEVSLVSSPLIGACLTSITSLTMTPEARDYLREGGCINALVGLLSAPSAHVQLDLVLRSLATLCTNNAVVATELVHAGAVPVLYTIVHNTAEKVFKPTSGGGSSEGDGTTDAAVKQGSADDILLTNCLWTVATASCSKEAHAVMLKEGFVELLVEILDKSPKLAAPALAQTFSDYSLSALLQLTASEDCRLLMINCKAHEILIKRVTNSPITVVRRSLQVLANLCVDESSRSAIALMPRVMDTILASTDKFLRNRNEAKTSGLVADQRALLQCLKLISNIIQTQEESNMFRSANGIAWLCNLATSYAAQDNAEPVVLQQMLHLSANLLLYQKNHDPWMEQGGLSLLNSCLNQTRAPGVRREAARAISNLVAFFDDVRDAAYTCGTVSALSTALQHSLNERDSIQFILFLLRALAYLALPCNRITEMYGGGILDVLGQTIKTFMDEDSPVTHSGAERAGVIVLVLTTLSNLSGSFEVSRTGDARNAVATNKDVGVEWTSSLIEMPDRSIQLQALKHFLVLETTWKGRAVLFNKQIDFEGTILVPHGNESSRVLKHFLLMKAKYDELIKIPTEVPKRQASAASPEAASAAAGGFRRGRRARHHALILTQGDLQSLSSGAGTDGLTPTQNRDAARQALLSEFATSERQYVSTLNVVLWKFERPLYTLPPNPPNGMIPSKVVATVFSSFESLAYSSTAHLDLLESRLRETGPETKVADLFKSLAATLQMYVAYSAQIPTILSQLKEAENTFPDFHDFVVRAEKSPHCGGRTLHALLGLPLDRVEYYASFLHDYCNAIPDDNEEKSILSECAVAADVANSQIIHHDVSSLDKILSIEQRLKGHFETLVTPGRRFVREGRLRLLQIGDKMLEAPIDCVMIVLSDLLLIAKIAKHDKFKVLDRIPLDDVIVSVDVAEGTVACGLDDCFKIFRSSSHDGKSGYLFAAITVRDKRLLVESIMQIKMSSSLSAPES